ncbi:Piwi domain-containing protein [Lactifluus subvellereus]|nr:Piwi domain-containing protein [Lactifluus subvellereus]
MYKPGPLIDLALAVLHISGNPNALAPLHGFPDRERIRLQRFISGIKITTLHGQQAPRPRVIKRLSREGASDLIFGLGNEQTTVADYFHGVLNRPLQFPDVVCVELSTGALIPLELCQVPPCQIMRKCIPPDQTNSVVEVTRTRPLDRLALIRNGFNVLEYGQSQYIHQFGMAVANELLRIQARVINAPTLRYHQSSKQPSVKPRDGAWNLVGKRMFSPSIVPTWIVIIYERQRWFNELAANQMVNNLVKGYEAQLRAACGECKHLPTLIIVVLPEGGNDIYAAVKRFGDVMTGVALYRLNVKLGGTNAVLEPHDVSSLTDLANPTIIMGAHVSQPPPGSEDCPSFVSLVGSIDTCAVRYVSTVEAQTSRKESIVEMESMVAYVLSQYKGATGKYPKRILFYRNGISFSALLEDELPRIRCACRKLGITPTITLMIVSKGHHVRFFLCSKRKRDKRSGNCLAGTVIDRDVVDPVEFDFYLLSHGGMNGTSRPAHYNVLIDENNFTADDLQSFSYALCHVNARTTCSISKPAPLLRKDCVLSCKAPLRPAPTGSPTNARTVEKHHVLLLNGAPGLHHPQSHERSYVGLQLFRSQYPAKQRLSLCMSDFILPLLLTLSPACLMGTHLI